MGITITIASGRAWISIEGFVFSKIKEKKLPPLPLSLPILPEITQDILLGEVCFFLSRKG